ncbi:MAG TPA: 4-oxalocrotonate tautomerase [Casimicrobiaceae bacterium]|nr:4-oxalocrotonate tautomerase [Casimicrobiaceae bacterium]
MPLFLVHMFEGRSAEQKRAFVEAITKTTCETLKCSPEAVDIIIHDVRREDWATAGVPWADKK